MAGAGEPATRLRHLQGVTSKRSFEGVFGARQVRSVVGTSIRRLWLQQKNGSGPMEVLEALQGRHEWLSLVVRGRQEATFGACPGDYGRNLDVFSRSLAEIGLPVASSALESGHRGRFFAQEGPSETSTGAEPGQEMVFQGG